MTNFRSALVSASANADSLVLINLRKAWNFNEDAPLLVVGRLSLPANDGAFGFLVDVEDPNSGQKLTSPASGQPSQAFIAPAQMAGVRAALLASDEAAWALAEVQLSPPDVRDERRDPYALMVVPGSLKLLVDLPDEWSVAITGPAKAQRILKLAHDAIAKRLEGESESLLRKLDERMAGRSAQLKEEQHKLQQARGAYAVEQSRLQELSVAGAGLKQEISSMQDRLRTMSALAAQKGGRLRALGLLEEDEIARLLPNSPKPLPPTGRLFAEVLSGDFSRVAPFVQSRLARRGIRYSQAQLRDFLALLCTHDLIVLAGDSGSGKTSMIRHVADAIGARHTIIPVKPNWTGPEDLLGFYNPIEHAYHPTPFLEALQVAAADPDVLHIICLDEMNLARVEYYFSDFLSLLEDRAGAPEIILYASDEERHAVVETSLFMAVEAEVRQQTGLPETVTMEEMLCNEHANVLLHRLAGMADASSLLEYHSRLRRSLAATTRHPTRLVFPSNVRIVGSVNMDETTHALSPKVLDRAHVMRFQNPALLDWGAMAAEVEDEIEDHTPIILTPSDFPPRVEYPAFDPTDPVTARLLGFARDFFDAVGVEFGLRAIRQSIAYIAHAHTAGLPADAALNNVILHKVLPKVAFDAGRKTADRRTRLDVLRDFTHLLREVNGIPNGVSEDAATALERMIRAAEDNNGVINFWSR